MNTETITVKEHTDQELLDMMPAKDAGHEAWENYHKALFEAGKLPTTKKD